MAKLFPHFATRMTISLIDIAIVYPSPNQSQCLFISQGKLGTTSTHTEINQRPQYHRDGSADSRKPVAAQQSH